MKSDLILIISFFTSATYAQSIKDGPWRGLFHQHNGTEVPFNFEVKGKQVYLLNGSERFASSGLMQKGDSVFIAFDQFDNELALRIDGKKLNGVLRRKDHSGRTTAVEASYGETFRFADNGEKPAADISGKYEVVFNGRSGSDEKRVGLIRQKGSKLYATFLSITGDSRYLEGVLQGNKFYLSSFIGGGATYYTGELDQNGNLSGTVNGQAFTAVKNEAAALPDPYKLTYLKEGYSRFDFTLPDMDGNTISLKDQKFKNKVVILTIGGTWCPNCIDEASFIHPGIKRTKAAALRWSAFNLSGRPTRPM